MPDLHSDAGGDDPDEVGPGYGSTTGSSRWQKVVGSIGLVVVAWVGADSTLVDAWFNDDGGTDHMPGGGDPDGEGPGGRDQSPGGDAPEGNREQEIDVDDGDHDPSQWDH